MSLWHTEGIATEHVEQGAGERSGVKEQDLSPQRQSTTSVGMPGMDVRGSE
ncbi:MAG: hypothetical protein JJD98_21275 [Polaromonas sp.]|nr:hypothetical protein [Polaromonas sp.]